MINSHIIIPRLLLKYFEIEHFFWYYDIDGGFIAKGNATSFNTEKGYYSDEIEQILSGGLESPLSNLLKRYSGSILNEDDFEMSQKDILIIKRFFYSLLCRNPQMVKQIKRYSVYYQFLPEVAQHGYAAVSGIKEGERQDVFEEYDVAFFVNHAETLFVLPNCGLYNLNLCGIQMMVSPVLPNLLFALKKNVSVKGPTIELQRGVITEDSLIKQMNLQALKQQISMNGGGRIICSQKEELERLKSEFQSNKSAFPCQEYFSQEKG